MGSSDDALNEDGTYLGHWHGTFLQPAFMPGPFSRRNLIRRCIGEAFRSRSNTVTKLPRRRKCKYRGSGPLYREVKQLMRDVNALEQDLMAVNFRIQELDNQTPTAKSRQLRAQLIAQRNAIQSELNKLYDVFGYKRSFDCGAR